MVTATEAEGLPAEAAPEERHVEQPHHRDGRQYRLRRSDRRVAQVAARCLVDIVVPNEQVDPGGDETERPHADRAALLELLTFDRHDLGHGSPSPCEEAT